MAQIIRNKSEEAVYKKRFSELINLFNDLSINFIDSGLLGIYRDGDIIK